MSQEVPETTHPATRPPSGDATAPQSRVSVPIRVSAQFLERSLDDVLEGLHSEAGLIYRHDDIDLGSGLTGSALVSRRSSAHVAMYEDMIVATLPVHVVLKPAWKPNLGPLSLPLDINLPLDISAEYTVRLRARPQLDADYNLRLNATYDYSVDRPVGVEAVGLDIGLTFGRASRAAAEEALENLCAWLNSPGFEYLNFREQVLRGWQALQQPMNLSLGHQLRLDIEPEAVHALPFRSEANSGVIGLAVLARVRGLASGMQPHAGIAPLPPVSVGELPPDVTLSLPLEVSFATLKDALRENIAHRPWRIEGRQVLLRAVDLAGNDLGELQARIDISVLSDGGGFDVEASLEASGCPKLNVDRQHLSLEGFRYEAQTDSRLLNLLAAVLRPFAGKLLEPWLDIPLAPHVQRLLDEINARLDEGIVLGEGIVLTGKAGDIRLTALTAHAQGMRLSVETHGELSISIDQA